MNQVDEAEGTADTAPARPIRVVLVDDHAVVRRGLAALLTSAGDIEVSAPPRTAPRP